MTDTQGGRIERFLARYDALNRGGRLEKGQVGVRLSGDIELTGTPQELARLGRELFERFSGQAFPDGITDPQALITGNPIDGFKYYGPTPLEEGDDNYRDVRTRLIEEHGEEWWLAKLRPLSDLAPIDGHDAPPVTPASRDHEASMHKSPLVEVLALLDRLDASGESFDIDTIRAHFPQAVRDELADDVASVNRQLQALGY